MENATVETPTTNIEIKTSEQFWLNAKDFGKALIVAVLTPVLLIVQQSIAEGSLTLNWKEIGMAAVAGGVGYLIKNFFTPAQTVIRETKK